MKFKPPILLISTMLILIVSGCSLLNIFTDYSYFYENTKDTAPVFTESTGRSLDPESRAANDAIDSIFNLLRDFDPAIHEGVLDRSNLYKLLYDVENLIEGGKMTATPITPTTLTLPFTDITSDTQYNKYGTNDSNQQALSIALNDSDDMVEAAVGWTWSEADNEKKMEYGLFTASFNTLNSDLDIDFAFSVDYNTDTTVTEYNNRSIITGNAATHSFKLSNIIGTQAIVGMGISQGTDNVMLFKYLDMETVKYIVIPTSAGEDWFTAQKSSETAIYTDTSLLPASVAAYKSWVIAEEFLTTENQITDISTLNASNSNAGTIMIYN